MVEFKVNFKTEKVFDTVKFILGFIALLVGIAGILLPVLPGWLLIFVGLELLGLKIVFLDNIKEYAKSKMQKRGKQQ